MKIRETFSTGKHQFPAILLMLLITLCSMAGCEKSNQNKAPAQTIIKKYEKLTKLQGFVRDDHGPLKKGIIKVLDNQDQILASSSVEGNGHYSVEIPAGTVLPIVLTYYSDTANPQTDKFVAAVVHPTITDYDLNPRTTAIAKQAKALGGYTHANLMLAAEGAATVPDKNKTTVGFRGDPTTQYGGWH